MAELLRLRAALHTPLPTGHTAAVLVPLVNESGEWEILFEVRSLTVRQPGEICFPGGRADPGETPEETALRETAEELGLLPADITVLGRLEADQHVFGRRVQPVVAQLAPSSLQRLCPAQSEVDSAFTVPVNWLLQNPPQRLKYTLLPRQDSSLPPILQGYLAHYDRPTETLYWEYEGHGIWGMTARILQNLLTVWQATEASAERR